VSELNPNTRGVSCPVCRATGARTLFSTDDFAIRECESCYLARTEPSSYVSTSHYDEAAQFSEDYLRREGEFRGYARKLLRQVGRFAPSGRFLEVGCTVGTLVDEAGRAGYDAEGIDLDSNAISFGKSLGRRLSRSTIQDWAGGDYDVIAMSHTLEHIPEPHDFLSEAFARLRPGGHLAIVVPCHDGLHPRIFGPRWYGWVAYQHYYHYSAKALTRLMNEVGFGIARIHQESMNYTGMVKRAHSNRQKVRAVLELGIASVGGWLGRGDQVVAIGRRDSPSTIEPPL
jgi:SAM-dependent methyltransferase